MDTRYLKLRRQTWYVQLAVPYALQEVIGKKVILQSLKTRDLTEARHLRWEVINELKATFSKLLRLHKAPPPKGSTAELLAVGETIRQQVRQRLLTTTEAAEWWDYALDQYLERHTDRRTGEPQVSDGDAQAIRDLGSAIGDTKAHLLSDVIDTHLAELEGIKRPSTIRTRRRRLQDFVAWLGRDPKLPSVTDDDTSRYLTEVLMKLPVSSKTVKDTLCDLSATWNWAIGRKFTKENPWAGLSRSVPKSTRGGTRGRGQPWTESELQTLLNGLPVTDPLWAMSVVALTTGMRANEIAETQLCDVHDQYIHVPAGKSESAERDVLLHPLVVPLVQYLRKHNKDGYLIPGLKRGGDDDKRSHYAAKRFTRVRRKLGLNRKGVVFHSLRHTYIHAAENAGIPESTAKLLVGHKRESLTYGLYSHGLSPEVLREAVDKVSHGKRIDRLVAKRVKELTSGKTKA